MGGKRKGRRAYLNDFTTNLQGDYVYQGSHFHYTGETPWERQLRRLWGLTLAMAIGLVGGGFLPAAGEGLYLILNGSGGRTAATLGYLGLEALAAVAAWRLAGLSSAASWEERREGGTDIGL